MRNRIFAWAICVGVCVQASVFAADPVTELRVTVTNNLKTVSWLRPTILGWDVNELVWSTNLTDWVTVPPTSTQIVPSPSNYVYRTVNNFPNTFFDLRLSGISSNDLLAATVMNRLAYGPTPDDFDTMRTSPQAYINIQLAPDSIPSTFDDYVAVQTNAVVLPPATNWTLVTVTGIVTSSTFYMYLREPGSMYIDDIRLQMIETVIDNGTVPPTTNTVLGNNVLVNGNFEQPLAVGWTVAPNMIQSTTTTDAACEGTSSCRLVATQGGTTSTSAIRQTVVPSLPNGRRCVLSFAYVQTDQSRLLTLRLSGSGVLISGADEPEPPEWIYVTTTGRATANPSIYLYLSGAGEGWLDDLKIVQGTTAEAGANLIANGTFESILTPWNPTGNHAGSVIDNTVARSGNGSLRLVATGQGSGSANGVVWGGASLVNGQTYTVSYWYRPATANRTLTVRLSGSQLVSAPDGSAGGLRRRLDEADWGVSLNEMRAWFGHNAIASPRQLIEVLTQFLENHFVTYHSKTADYFDRYYDGGVLDRIATDLEYREVSRWRHALLNPNCNFYDLLKIHVESPAQIIYLDTVESRGDGTRIANENYARELFELFCMGVDNGYDQNDIVAMSRAWTGWTVDIVDRQDMDNPFARRSQQYGYYPGAAFNAVSNIVGVWSFVFNTNWHGTNRAPILSQWDPNGSATDPVAIGAKTIPARFGAPWAGRPYQLTLPRSTGTNGIRDGYLVINHLANGPALVFTAEYLSIKLCRLFIHDDFPNPTTRPELPEYAFYDYSNPNRSAEAELIRRCIAAWDTPGPDGRKGHIRAVLRTIFDSELFRTQTGNRQKVKTPLEFCVSAVRALRSVDDAGQATALTDGSFSTQLSRMGNMSLFNRADPDGYPEEGAAWVSAGTLSERLRFVQALCTNPGASNPGRPSDASGHSVDPVALIQRKFPGLGLNPRNAGDVASYFVNMFFFGEGAANLDLYRKAAVEFLNNGSADPSPSTTPFGQLTVSGTANEPYDHRVRGMVSLLMTTQRFQEQ